MSGRTLLVSGASGHLGRTVIAELLAANRGDTIIAGTRTPARLGELTERGVDRFLIISTDATDRPGHRVEQHGRAVAAAAAALASEETRSSVRTAAGLPAGVIEFLLKHRNGHPRGMARRRYRRRGDAYR